MPTLACDRQGIATALYFTAFVFFGSIFVTSLYVAILCSQYQSAYEVFMTEGQSSWFEAQKARAAIEYGKRMKLLALSAERRKSEAQVQRFTTKLARRSNTRPIRLEVPKHVRNAFERFDMDRNGWLDHEELPEVRQLTRLDCAPDESPKRAPYSIAHVYGRPSAMRLSQF